MLIPADQDKINTVSHVSTLCNPNTDIRATPTLIHIALTPPPCFFLFTPTEWSISTPRLPGTHQTYNRFRRTVQQKEKLLTIIVTEQDLYKTPPLPTHP